MAYAIATGAGAGFAPVAPGTFGAVEGVALFLGFVALTENALAISTGWRLALLVVINVALFAVGVWASNCACEICGLDDPRQVVIDEVSGQLITLIPLAAAPSGPGVFLGFVLFRLFDILKPFPIRQLERLHSGLGVMADDAMAGLYAGLLVWLALALRWV